MLIPKTTALIAFSTCTFNLPPPPGMFSSTASNPTYVYLSFSLVGRLGPAGCGLTWVSNVMFKLIYGTLHANTKYTTHKVAFQEPALTFITQTVSVIQSANRVSDKRKKINAKNRDAKRQSTLADLWIWQFSFCLCLTSYGGRKRERFYNKWMVLKGERVGILTHFKTTPIERKSFDTNVPKWKTSMKMKSIYPKISCWNYLSSRWKRSRPRKSADLWNFF